MEVFLENFNKFNKEILIKLEAFLLKSEINVEFLNSKNELIIEENLKSFVRKNENLKNSSKSNKFEINKAVLSVYEEISTFVNYFLQINEENKVHFFYNRKYIINIK